MVRDPGIGAFYYPSSGKEMKAFGQDRVPIDGRSFWCPHPAQTGPARFDELETNPKVLLNPLLERITRIAALHPDDLKARQFSDQRHKQLAASLPIAEGSFEHLDRHQQALGVHQQMPFSAPDFFFRRRSRASRLAPNCSGID